MTPTELDAAFERFRRGFLGLSREDAVHTLEGGSRQARRVYLDSGATALMPSLAWDGLREYFEASSANSHTGAHRAGRATTQAIEDARCAVGRLVGYDPARDVVLFTGNGATGAINFLARAMFPPELRLPLRRCPDGPPPLLLSALRAVFPGGADAIDALLARPLVVSSVMEHHSNLLPWVEAVGRHHVRFVPVRDDGTLDLDALRDLLAREGSRVRVVALSGASNVTGVLNPLPEIARMAHAAGAALAVDAAQLAPHHPIRMHPSPGADIDYLVLSGHKLYAPGSRGVLIGDFAPLAARACIGDVGGGMVEYVSVEDFQLKAELTAREEAGTPNIPGTVALGLVAEALGQLGMERVAAHERDLCAYALRRLGEVPDLEIYGPRDPVARVCVVAFTLRGMHHGLVAAWLDDFHNVAVRNECFCAHPYVKRLLRIDAGSERDYLHEIEAGDRRHVPGMVRISLGVYTTREDIDVAVSALGTLSRERERIAPLYQQDADGSFRLRAGVAAPVFTLGAAVSRRL